MGADFTPSKSTLKPLGQFRHWCNKVLPMVYDDSLSYYELLNKVVVYLNDALKTVDMLAEDFEKLYGAYIQLQEYVNTYFENLDVQNEINIKLDVMAGDGSLSELIQPLFDVFKAQINEIVETQNGYLDTMYGVINDQNRDIEVLTGRMNQFSKLPDGSVVSDAEITDARVDYNGRTWTLLGNRIRGFEEQMQARTSYTVGEVFSFTSESDNVVSTNILKCSYSIGTTLVFDVTGANCNICGIDADTGETVIIVNNALGGRVYEVTLANNISWFGIYHSKAGSTTVIVKGKYAVLVDEHTQRLANLDKKVDGKVDILEVFVNKEITIKEGYLWASPTKEWFKFDLGTSAEGDVTGVSKIRVSGMQWADYTSFPFYRFYNAENKLLGGSSVERETGVKNLVVDVPVGAVTIRINGSGSNPPKLEIADPNYTNFEKCFNKLYSEKSGERTEPIKLMTLGDSITKLGTEYNGWIKYFIEKTGATLIANTAVDSAVLPDYPSTVYDGNPQSSKASGNVLGNQIQKIINNNYAEPDIIIIAIGTNSGIYITKDDIKNTYYGNGNTLIPLENVDRKTSAGAYRYALETLHNLYPNALIFWCSPIMAHESQRTSANVVSWANSLNIATEYTGQTMIDTHRCGINGVNEFNGSKGEYLIDGLHPCTKGARKLGYYIASKVKPFFNCLLT